MSLSTPSTRTPDAAAEALSARELDVLRLLGEGFDNQTVAERLAVKLTTVRNHVQSIIEKLGVHSKLEAVISSMEEGVIPLDPEGRILGVNAAAKELFELRDDPQGLRLWEVLRLPGLEEAATKALRKRVPVRDAFEVAGS